MWFAAVSTTAGLDANQVIIAISGLLVAVVTAAAGVVVAVVNSRKKSETIVNPPDFDSDDWAYLRERVAILEQRMADRDNSDEIQDRRLNRIERHIDLDNPFWRGAR